MKILSYKHTIALIVLVAVMGIFSIVSQAPWKVGASVAVGNQYQSVFAPSVVDETNLCPARAVGQASSTTGVLGSVVVTGINTGSFILYDATTTDNNLRASAATSSLILFELPATTAASATTTGTLTLDVQFNRGLLVDKVGNVATSTITYRCEG